LVFCSSGTESDNLALWGTARALRDKGNHIVTTAIEHPAVLHTCKALEREGFRVTYTPVTADGVVDLSALSDSICKDTIVVSAMHANNETGVLQPIEEIAAMASRRGIVVHTDAVQTAGKLPIWLAELGADLVTFSAHKLCGPKGVGALYIRKGTPIQEITTGGAQERGLRAGTENVAGIVGFAEAVALAFEHAQTEGQRLQALRRSLEDQIRPLVPKTRIQGERVSRVPNTSNLTFDSVDGESIVLGLDLQDICVSTGSACSTGDPEPSHVLLAMGLSAREAQGSIRISLGQSTQQADIDASVKALQVIVARLRGISSIGT
jgi:cysteine desulfurase